MFLFSEYIIGIDNDQKTLNKNSGETFKCDKLGSKDYARERVISILLLTLNIKRLLLC